MKPVIIAIVGESGSGKTTAAEYLNEKYGFKLIQSRTTRPPRYEGENGHTFVSNDEFDTYKEEDIIALTLFGNNRYCCLHSDVVDGVNTYVIDEIGLLYLKYKYADRYDIKSIRLVRELDDRIKSVGEERVSRDEGKFKLPYSYYDNVVMGGNLDILYSQMDKFVQQNILGNVKLG